MSKFLPVATLAFVGATSLQARADEPIVAPSDPASQKASKPTDKLAPIKSTPAQASKDGQQPAAASGERVQKVTINGSRQSDMDERRMSTAAKMIFGREELDRNGDSTIGEILKRLPGVTVGGRPGRGGDIRMRGMGNGYTQILINGERAPRGFSMDSLSPDQVERIEIIRGPVAEYSTQAIAGTINIVLREDYRQKTTDIRISDSLEQGRNAPNLSVTYPGQLGDLSYALTASISQNRQHDEVSTDTSETNAQGQLEQHQHDQTSRLSRGLQLTPRFSYRFENGDTLMFQPFVMNSRSDSRTTSKLDQIGELQQQEYALANSVGNAETTFVRGFGNWQHKFDDNSKLNIKFGGGAGKMDSSSLRSEYGTGGGFLKSINDTSATKDTSLNAGGKFTKPVGDGHTLAAGLDVEAGKRNQTKVSVDDKGNPQFADSGDNLTASTRRLAAFVQDEFDVNEQFSAYAGLRWEGIRTKSTISTGVVDNTSSVWSPVLHGVWRIPGEKKDQIRLSLTHAYRAPALNDLIALPSISPLNGPTKPDRTGNPFLKPELSKGVDLAYEHYLTSAGIMSANFFVRDINDLIRRNTVLTDTLTGPRWVSSPVNIGHAITKGIELEAKFQLQEFLPEGPAIDVRSNYSRFRSSVDGIQGPNNRLDQQPKETANFGLDYRLAKMPLTLGGNYNWTPAYAIQSTDTQLNSTGLKRQIDLYGLWKFSPTTQLRVAANNLQANDYLSGSVVTTGGINHVDATTAKTYTTWTVRLEMKI
ncbi:TonB-dependent receptor [Undibacterium sp.]|jgi:outer membrane receptor for ferrienterochelin and colicins|uniref:TonB-dependent receptor plug domain-containing protein n=1 Tax=Undibacterium sp. TaxID=1914977 RepID=UPI002B9BAAC3|nr:TonB-dependent receptor [Undibacterium sp.]HTD02755.1 TonB-dependent receptor [Undibacterium sp.]